ncbi:extracellular solute-binding protein [Desertihabitans aurantiacus]|uniref:extracellular solute-binding protein n=1 Tax=Desertihabitans aurantiacus TaxID=2282477 RepID=UPI000DF75380|nr:extracellular solute-binding protein [Desertihabitans aurantiacus]
MLPLPPPQLSRRALLGGAAAAAVAGLTGCASQRSASRLSFLVNHTNQEATLFQQVVDEWLQTRPELSVAVQNIANGAQFYTRLRTVSVTRDLPDIWYARTLDTAFNVANEWQLPLTDRIAADPDVDVSDMWPAQVRQMSIGDQQYSLPYDFSCYAIYYNKSMFDEVGIARPDDENWTWPDLFDLAGAFTRIQGRRQDRWGFYFSLGSWLFDGIFRANGGALFDDEGRRCLVGSEQNIETMRQLFAQLANGNAAQPQTLGAAVDPFVSGLVAMSVQGSWATAQTRDQVGDRFEWDLLKLPRGSTGRREVATAGGAWGISVDSANPDAAFALIKYLSAREQLNTFISEPLRGIPGRASSAADEVEMTRGQDLPPRNFAILSEQFLDDAYEVTYPPFWAEYETIWNNRSTALNAGAAPEDILPQIERDTNAASARYFAAERSGS